LRHDIEQLVVPGQVDGTRAFAMKHPGPASSDSSAPASSSFGQNHLISNLKVLTVSPGGRRLYFHHITNMRKNKMPCGSPALPLASLNRLAAMGVLLLFLTFKAQAQVVNFGGVDPNGFSFTGTISFNNGSLVPTWFDATLADYTNAEATISLTYKGTNLVIQSMYASIETAAYDPVYDEFCDSLQLQFPASFPYGLIAFNMYADLSPRPQYAPSADITDPQWWSNRLPSPWDVSIRIGSIASNVDAAVSFFGPPPVLSVGQTNGVISYPTNAVGYVLESSPCLGPGEVWSVVTNAPVINFTNWFVSVPVGNGPSFYRLGTTN
jgi:hypothetical protein